MLADFHKLNEGPQREARSTLIQVGWLGHTGGVYPWWEPPTADQEPAGYMPLHIERGED